MGEQNLIIIESEIIIFPKHQSANLLIFAISRIFLRYLFDERDRINEQTDMEQENTLVYNRS